MICKRPQFISDIIVTSSLNNLKYISDIKRNYKSLHNLCIDLLTFQENKYDWKMIFITNPNKPKGVFWFLPHDNENTAFDSAIYAIQKYGGGFLSIVSLDNRYFKGQDPNRNFGTTLSVAKHCKKQKYPAPIYTNLILDIIDSYRIQNIPYLSLHNNTNRGNISILKSTKNVKSYPAYSKIIEGSGLEDEDNLVYMSGNTQLPNKNELNMFLKKGLNVRFEIVTNQTNDCSLSNYIILNNSKDKYFNIEAQHNNIKIQKKMIDKLMSIIYNKE